MSFVIVSWFCSVVCGSCSAPYLLRKDRALRNVHEQVHENFCINQISEERRLVCGYAARIHSGQTFTL